MDLTAKKCVPCEGGIPPLPPERVRELLGQLHDWKLSDDGRKISRRLMFDDFVQNVAFINRMAHLAESEGHHPDFAVKYSVLDVTLYTHAIGGLSENDFILAAKIDRLFDDRPKT